MLNLLESGQAHGGMADEGFEPPETAAGGVTPLQVALHRKWAILVFATVVAAIIGFLIEQVPVRYAATARLMLDSRQPRVSDGQSLLPSQAPDPQILRTQIEALISPALAREVVEQLGLTSVAEFCATPPDAGEAIQAAVDRWLGRPRRPPAAPAVCHASVDSAVKRLMPLISASNDGRSYIIDVGAQASDPMLAANIANAYAKAVIDRQNKEREGLTEQADGWLAAHLGELRAAVVAADAAVEQLQQSRQLTPLRGETLLAQSLSELNTQLSVATSELAQKQSLLRALEELQRSGTMDASATALASPVIQRLIEQANTVAEAQAELRSRVTNANPLLIGGEAQLAQIRRQIRVEVGKTLAAARGEVDALAARRTALAGKVQELQSQVGEQGLANIRLRDLQSDAASARGRYDAAAVRLEQIRVEAATQRPDVKLVIDAAPPLAPSFPRTNMIIAGAFMVALGVGAGLAFAQALLSPVFRDPEHLEALTGARVLGLFPRPARRRVRPQDTVVDNPTSREAEALHAVFTSLIGGHFRDDTRPGLVWMVTSAVPGEGKTSFSVALGRAAARWGMSVVVVDCDLRRSSMRGLFPIVDQHRAPVTERAAKPIEHAPRHAALTVDRSSGMNVVLAPPPGRNPHAILASASLSRTLEQLRADHDIVIIDTPPVLAVPDALSLAALVDDIVMLVGWPGARRAAVLAAFKILRRARIQVRGVVLSKVNLRRFSRARYSHGYYAGSYPSYHAAVRD